MPVDHAAALPFGRGPASRRPRARRRRQPPQKLRLLRRRVPDGAQPGGVLAAVPEFELGVTAAINGPGFVVPDQAELRGAIYLAVHGGSGIETCACDNGGPSLRDALVLDEPEAASAGDEGEEDGGGRVARGGCGAGVGRFGAVWLLYGVRGKRRSAERRRVVSHSK